MESKFKKLSNALGIVKLIERAIEICDLEIGNEALKSKLRVAAYEASDLAGSLQEDVDNDQQCHLSMEAFNLAGRAAADIGWSVREFRSLSITHPFTHAAMMYKDDGPWRNWAIGLWDGEALQVTPYQSFDTVTTIFNEIFS